MNAAKPSQVACDPIPAAENYDEVNPFGNAPPPSLGNVSAPAAAPMNPTIAIPSVTTGTPGITATSELDSKGFPWDARIHASSKAKTKDGSWRYQRGVGDDVIAQVEAQLRGSVQNTGSAPFLPPAPAPVAPIPPTPSAPQPAPVIAPPPIAPSAPVVPPLQQPAQVTASPVQPSNVLPLPQPGPTVTAAHTLETFKANMPLVIATLVKEGKLTQEYINAVLRHCGVAQLWDMNDQQLGEFFEMLVKNGFVSKVM